MLLEVRGERPGIAMAMSPHETMLLGIAAIVMVAPMKWLNCGYAGQVATKNTTVISRYSSGQISFNLVELLSLVMRVSYQNHHV